MAQEGDGKMVKVCIQEVNDLEFYTLTYPECPYFQKTDEIEFNEEYPEMYE